ncbi:hypothetical protein [Chromobacterium haemolyticum]|uniref:hypothetical protein n=1 Tax=Chromobacterium TaxID=535 RepID=UPI004056BDF1
MNKTHLIFSSLLILSSMALATDGLALLPKPSGQAITINGKLYYKPAPTVAKSGGIMPRSSTPVTLHRGELLQPASQRELATVSGMIFVRLITPADEAAVARAYDLRPKVRTQNVVVFDTSPQVELLSLQQRLQADKRVKQVQLELASDTEQPK